jgi:hypothetical protein
MTRFAIGAVVRRKSLRGWRIGEVVCEVPPLANPAKIFRRWHAGHGWGLWRGSFGRFVPRDDWSYIVRAGWNYYWPRVTMLERHEVCDE